jgi:hypothetical protein
MLQADIHHAGRLLGHLPTTQQALDECSFWMTPSRIKVKPSSHDPRFKEIVQLDYTQEKKREKVDFSYSDIPF